MRGNFDKCLEFTLRWEGGLRIDPDEPGGASNHGVSQVTYDAYLTGKKLPHKPVIDISDEEVKDIYYNLYWKKINADFLPFGVDQIAFDIAVNSGVHRAKDMLTASWTTPIPKNRIMKLDELRRNNWAEAKNFLKYRKGWFRRESDCLATSLKMVEVA